MQILRDPPPVPPIRIELSDQEARDLCEFIKAGMSGRAYNVKDTMPLLCNSLIEYINYDRTK